MSDDKYVEFDLQTLLTPLAIIIAGGIIASGIYFGFKNADFGASVAGAKTEQNTDTTDTADTADTPTVTKATVNIDDDPYIGNKDTAKVAVVEFSDFDCPFCKKFYSETLGELKRNFTDSGEVIFVYRDLPLPNLHAHAESKAQGAECAGEQGGNNTYFKFHDALYEESITDNAGLISLAESLGLNKQKFADCLESGQMADEVDKDVADAQEAGIAGTPGFIVGIIDGDGNVTGTKISGAYPYANFEQAIKSYLGK